MLLLDSNVTEVYARAPLKAILSGEHSVIYGYPCIAIALDLYTTGRARISKGSKCPSCLPFPIFLDNRTGEHINPSTSMKEAIRLINEEVLSRLNVAEKPGTMCYYYEFIAINVHKWTLGKGLGSSASILATYTALLLAGSSISSPSTIFDVALLGENHIHGKTTGMDLRTVIYGGIQIYDHRKLNHSKIHPNVFLSHNIHILIADSGRPKATSEAVELVKQGQCKDILEQIGLISENIIKLLSSASDSDQRSDEDICQTLSSLLKQNHNLLCLLGVSVTEIEYVKNTLYHMGCFAAKLTGAGLGGCCIGLSTGSDFTADTSNTQIMEVGVGEGLLVTT